MIKIKITNDVNIIVVIASILIHKSIYRLPNKNKYSKRLKTRNIKSVMLKGIDIMDKYIKVENRQTINASSTETTKFPNTN